MLFENQYIDREASETPALPPTTVAGLNPARWGPILTRMGSAHAPLRTGNAVHALIDGAETFRSMVQDIRATRGEYDYIYLLGWDLTETFNMAPGLAPIPTSFAALLREANARGVQSRVMLWAKPAQRGHINRQVTAINRLSHGAALRDDHTANNHPLSAAQIGSILTHGNVNAAAAGFLMATYGRTLTSLLGAHHQKVLVIKRGETLVAYCGGVDINENRLNPVEPNDPQHDAHCRIIGPAAWDLLQTFIKRWRHHPDSAAVDAGTKGPLWGASQPIPVAVTSPSIADAPFGGTSSVMIARTFNPTHRVPGTPVVTREREIKDGVLAGILNAQSFIYIEDQYLIDMAVAAALNTVLPRLRHVTILIPGNGITEAGHPFIQEYRRDFINLARSGLSAADAAKLRVFQRSVSSTSLSFGPHTYVHAKTWVIDDELAIIGSANCNRRGYQHDSEVSAFVFGSDTGWNGSSSFAQAYRMRLWHEHLGSPLSQLINGVTSASLWQSASRPSSAHVFEFDHRLPPPGASSSGSSGVLGTIGGATGLPLSMAAGIISQPMRDLAATALHRYIDPPMP
jgi:phosphatidylserine/phosphatidylglycerophosphate/cardiolipin synthase-like enzyme